MCLPTSMSSISFSFTTLATLAVSVAITLWQSQSDPVAYLYTSMANAPSELVLWVSELLRATQLSKSVVFLSLLYLSKLNQVVPMTYFSPVSSITVSLVLASKYLEDNTYSNQAWASLAGMDTQVLARLEMQMLDMLNYNLAVSPCEYSQWIGQMQHAIVKFPAPKKSPAYPIYRILPNYPISIQPHEALATTTAYLLTNWVVVPPYT